MQSLNLIPLLNFRSLSLFTQVPKEEHEGESGSLNLDFVYVFLGLIDLKYLETLQFSKSSIDSISVAYSHNLLRVWALLFSIALFKVKIGFIGSTEICGSTFVLSWVFKCSCVVLVTDHFIWVHESFIGVFYQGQAIPGA